MCVGRAKQREGEEGKGSMSEKPRVSSERARDTDWMESWMPGVARLPGGRGGQSFTTRGPQ